MTTEARGEYIEQANDTVVAEEIIELVVIKEYATSGNKPPKGRFYEIEIDDQITRFSEQSPEGNDLLERVNKKSCQWKLLKVIQNQALVVNPEDKIDLRSTGIECFRTEIRNEVTVFVEYNNDIRDVTVPPGQVSVATIKQRADVPQTHTLYAPRPGLPPGPVPDDGMVFIEGCEEFTTQSKSGGSS